MIENCAVNDCHQRELRAEIEQLKAENADLRRWKAMDKPLTAALKVVSNDMQRLKAQTAEAATFLDGLAEAIEGPPFHCIGAAADCRAMAAKLKR